MIRLRFRSGRLLSHSLVMLRFTCNRDVFEFGRRTLVVNGRPGWLSRCVRSFQRPCTSSRCSLLSASETFEQEISWTPVDKSTDSSTWFFVLVQSSGWSLIIGNFASLRYFDDVSSVSITLGDSQTFDCVGECFDISSVSSISRSSAALSKHSNESGMANGMGSGSTTGYGTSTVTGGRPVPNICAIRAKNGASAVDGGMDGGGGCDACNGGCPKCDGEWRSWPMNGGRKRCVTPPTPVIVWSVGNVAKKPVGGITNGGRPIDWPANGRMSLTPPSEHVASTSCAVSIDDLELLLTIAMLLLLLFSLFLLLLLLFRCPLTDESRRDRLRRDGCRNNVVDGDEPIWTTGGGHRIDDDNDNGLFFKFKFGSNFTAGVIEINGLDERWPDDIVVDVNELLVDDEMVVVMAVAILATALVAIVNVGDDEFFDWSEFGEADRLRQFFSHKSGVIKFVLELLFSRRCGFISRCAWVSLQNICILYWLRHLSEQNCSCDAPSWKST